MFVMPWICKKGTVKALWLLSDQEDSIRKYKRAILTILALSIDRSKQFFVDRMESRHVIKIVGFEIPMLLTMRNFLFKL
jgi:hypothetical protein